MALVKCPDCGKDISDSAPTCPGCGKPMSAQTLSPPARESKNNAGKSILLALLICGLVGAVYWRYNSAQKEYGTSTPRLEDILARPAPTPPVARGVELELEDFNWGAEYAGSIAQAVGRVKNISDRPIRLMAVVSFFDKDDNLLTNAEHVLDFLPVNPGQVSPFHVSTNWKQGMAKVSIVFKESRGGGAIGHKLSEKLSKKMK